MMMIIMMIMFCTYRHNKECSHGK